MAGLPRRVLMAAITLGCLALTACGTAERINQLNPFRGEETDDPNAPAASERISVLAFDDSRRQAASFGEPLTLPPAYVNDRWSQPDGYPTHAMQHTQATGGLNRIWRADVGQGSDRSRRLNARPVLLDGVIYTIDANGRVSAQDATTGARRWSHVLRAVREAGSGRSESMLRVPFIGGGSGAGPDRISFGGGIAVDGGRVYVHRGATYFTCLDAATGEEVWRQPAFTPFHSSPTVADGRVFVTTDDNELMAMDAATGDVLWTHRGISESARLLTAPSPAVFGEVVVVPYTSGELVALRVQNGTVLWSDSLTRAGGLTPLSSINDIAGSPVIMDDRVYALSHSGVMAAFDMRSGERVWTQAIGGLHTPWVAGDFLFVVTSEGELVALERASGDVRWTTQLPAFRNERRRRNRIAWAGPIMAGGRLVLASSEGELYIVDAATGDIQGDRSLGEATFIAPIIANNTVYVLTDDAQLLAFQ